MTAKPPSPPPAPPSPPPATRPAAGGGLARPYPAQWEDVADLRVFRTTAEEWGKLIAWRTDMRKRGWKLLKVASEGSEMVAIFGRTKQGRGGPGGRGDSSTL